jgi:hypothetical protein
MCPRYRLTEASGVVNIKYTLIDLDMAIINWEDWIIHVDLEKIGPKFRKMNHWSQSWVDLDLDPNYSLQPPH